MSVTIRAKVSSKGQIVIPKAARDSARIRPGGEVTVRAEGDSVVLRAVPRDPIAAARGMAGPGSSLTRALVRERRRDRDREDAPRSR